MIYTRASALRFWTALTLQFLILWTTELLSPSTECDQLLRLTGERIARRKRTLTCPLLSVLTVARRPLNRRVKSLILILKSHLTTALKCTYHQGWVNISLPTTIHLKRTLKSPKSGPDMTASRRQSTHSTWRRRRGAIFARPTIPLCKNWETRGIKKMRVSYPSCKNTAPKLNTLWEAQAYWRPSANSWWFQSRASASPDWESLRRKLDQLTKICRVLPQSKTISRARWVEKVTPLEQLELHKYLINL